MSKIYKRLIIVLSVCFLLVTGLFVVSVSAADVNWLAVKYENKQTRAFLGEKIVLPETKPVYPQKVASYFYVVESPDGKTVMVEDDDFFVEKEGTYKVYICVVGNDGSTYSEYYSVTAEKSSAPVLTEEPVFPVAFLEGSSYNVPEVTFTDYNTEIPSVAEYEVYSVDLNGKETKLDKSFSPKVSMHGETISLKYVAVSTVTNERKTVIFDDLPVFEPFIENEYGERIYEYDKMFLTEQVEGVSTTEKGVKFYGTEEFTISYANNLHADFSISMLSEENLMNFEKLKITLTDAFNQKQYLTFEYSFNDAENTSVVVNGGDSFIANGSLKNYTKGFALSFSQATLRLFDSESKLVTTVVKTATGKEFKGFDSQLIKLKIEVKGLSGRSVLQINDVNGHGMNRENGGIDRTLPYVFPEKDFVYKNGIGDVIFLSKAIAVDVVDPCMMPVVTVYDPDGNLVKDKNGLELYEVNALVDYEFIVENIGTYTIQYSAKDVNYNSYNYGYYSVYVLDTVAPVVTVKNALTAEVSVGEKITLSEAKATDNITNDNEIVVFVTVSGGKKGVQYLNPGDEVVFDSIGMYYVRFTAVDKSCNISTVEYVINCK